MDRRLPSRIADYARSRFEFVSVGAQDASRARPDSLWRFALLAQRCGAQRLRVADTVGAWNPMQTTATVRQLREMEIGRRSGLAANPLPLGC